MKPSKYSTDEKFKIIQEAKDSGNIAATAKRYNVSDVTIHGWIRKLITNKNSKKVAIDSSALEIKKLKKQLNDKELENSILKELVKKTVQIWSNESQSLMNSSPEKILNQKF